ncbi:MlaD family protein [Nocardia sp. NPDC050175]|uniref:MlaD family protein n=1 Tax=Nocardia sp. NPDC050175 TaxID=3364317 RepID=UPI0037A0196D
MPAFGMPGVAVSPRGARLVGMIAAVLATAGVLAWRVAPVERAADSLSVTLLTEKVGDGVEPGIDVRLDGVKVGRIDSISATDGNRQRMILRLDRTQLFGLTDTLDIAYTPGNLFGISELVLKPGAGGAILADNAQVDLTGSGAGRVVDATISTLLQSIGQLANGVLTPKLTALLSQIATDAKAFTPLLQAIVVLATTVADTQQLPSAFLLEQYGSALSGLPPTVDGLLRVVDALYNSPELKDDTDRTRFDASVVLVRDNIIAALPPLLSTAQHHFDGYTHALAPVLTMVARALPPSDRTNRQLSDLLDGLNTAMPDTPDGPVLRLDLALSGVPGLAQPLLHGLPSAASAGTR